MIHEAIKEKRELEPNGRSNPSTILTILLLTIGKIWLFIQLGSFGVWWASFIFMAAMPFYMAAWSFYRRENGRLTFPLGLSLSIGLIITTVATLFWLALDWSVWWPTMLIVPGLALWANGQMRPTVDKKPVRHSLGLFASWSGVTTFLLGSTFLAHNCEWIDLAQLFPTIGWWGYFILLPGLGLLVSLGRVKHFYSQELLLFWDSITAVIIATGAVQLINFPTWSFDHTLGSLLIAAGLLQFIHRAHTRPSIHSKSILAEE
ncbi:MAG: hypothetical protein AAF614_30105 [Chloroflexota bacterium]